MMDFCVTTFVVFVLIVLLCRRRSHYTEIKLKEFDDIVDTTTANVNEIRKIAKESHQQLIDAKLNGGGHVWDYVKQICLVCGTTEIEYADSNWNDNLILCTKVTGTEKPITFQQQLIKKVNDVR